MLFVVYNLLTYWLTDSWRSCYIISGCLHAVVIQAASNTSLSGCHVV